jgi:endoribonuclease Nob1
LVLDTSAFLAGFDPFSVSAEQVTVLNVEEEIRTNSMTWVRFKAATESGKVLLKKPSEDARRQVEACAVQVGDSFFLSEADKQVLALALELKITVGNPSIVTDDYSIQNVAKRLGIEFTSLATLGIRRVLEWIRYCPACHREYAANRVSIECDVCGTELKRKPRKYPKPKSS